MSLIPTFIDFVRRNAKLGMVVAEIGVHLGETTREWLPIVEENSGLGIAVDTFGGSPTVRGPQGATVPEIYNRFRKNVAWWKDRFLIVYPTTSLKAAEAIGDKTLDICFIDASHLYADVTRDIAAYRPKVKPGGFLCGHDLDDLSWANTYAPNDFLVDCTRDRGHAGVIQAVWDAFGNDVEVIKLPDDPTPPCWVKRL